MSFPGVFSVVAGPKGCLAEKKRLETVSSVLAHGFERWRVSFSTLNPF